MPMAREYAYQKKSGARVARARLRGMNASYKDLCEVCRSVRGKDTDYALEFLGLASEGKRAIYFARHNSGKGHRRELGGRTGGWPVKSAGLVLGVVGSAAANAGKLGLGPTRVAHIIANKQDTLPRMSPKGRRIRHDYETAFVEVVLEEKQETTEAKGKNAGVAAQKSPAKKEEAKKQSPAKEAKPAEAKKETKQ